MRKASCNQIYNEWMNELVPEKIKILKANNNKVN